MRRSQNSTLNKLASVVRLEATQGRLEAIQWLAFGCMVVDHFGVFLSGNAFWMRVVGRLAFPLFALVFAWRLADGLNRDPKKALLPLGLRLLVSGIAAQSIFWLMTADGLEEWNVMFTFALAAFVIATTVRERSTSSATWGIKMTMAAIALGALSPLVDYKYPGMILILGLFSFFRWNDVSGLFFALGALIFMSFKNEYHAAFLAAPVAWYLLTSHRLPEVGKLHPRFFYLAYPGHLMAILALLVSRAPRP